MSCSSSTYTAWGSLECDDPRPDIHEDFARVTCPATQCMVSNGSFTPSGSWNTTPGVRLAPGGSAGFLYRQENRKIGCKQVEPKTCTGPIDCVKAWGPSKCGIINSRNQFQIAGGKKQGSILREREYIVEPSSGYGATCSKLQTRDTAATCKAVACNQSWSPVPKCKPCGNKSQKITYTQNSTGITSPAIYGGSCIPTRTITVDCGKNSMRACPRVPLVPAPRSGPTEGYASYF